MEGRRFGQGAARRGPGRALTGTRHHAVGAPAQASSNSSGPPLVSPLDDRSVTLEANRQPDPVGDRRVDVRGLLHRLVAVATRGEVPVNPTRRGTLGQLVAYAAGSAWSRSPGSRIRRPRKASIERFHQTLFRWLDKQPIAANLRELQAQIDAFDHIYNTERPHQGLPRRITPLAAWEATPKADPPRPRPASPRKLHAPPPSASVPQGRIDSGRRGRVRRRADHSLRRNPPGGRGGVLTLTPPQMGSRRRRSECRPATSC